MSLLGVLPPMPVELCSCRGQKREDGDHVYLQHYDGGDGDGDGYGGQMQEDGDHVYLQHYGGDGDGYGENELMPADGGLLYL